MSVCKKDIVWHQAAVTRKSRENQNNHRSVNLWFTGLSGSGKSTLAHAVEKRLHELGCRSYVFDGDNVRHGLCSDLDFSADGRTENIRRISEMVKLFLDAGMIALTAFISPFARDRAMVRDLLGEDDFLEIYCKCSLSVCESRDVKGLYKKARSGEIARYTGISSPYEEPQQPALVVETGKTPLEESVQQVLDFLWQQGVIPRITKEANAFPRALRQAG